MAGKLSIDKYLVLITVLSAAYFTYWIFWGNYLYTTFKSSYFDIGGYTYAMYLHINGLMYMNPLQYLVFFNHIAPSLVLLMPIFTLYQHPITLIIIQQIFLALTTILVYFVASDIFKDKRLAFVLAFAFLINPGIRGLVWFDFHPEAFIAFFYILSFYFYYKRKTKYFILSYILLLGIMETAYLVGATLILALLIYELIYNSRSKGSALKNYKEGLKLIGIGIGLTVIAAIFYHVAAGYIINSYASTSNYAIPPISRLINFIKIQSDIILNPGLVSKSAYYNEITWGGLGSLSVLFGFGIWSLLNPLISLVSYSPWLTEVFYLHFSYFAWFSRQYYSYVVGASLVSSVLGLLILARYKPRISKMLKISIKSIDSFVIANILIFSILFSVIALVGINTALLTFPANPSINSSQIATGLAMIPYNATVLVQPSIAPHISYIRELELPPIYGNFGVYISNLTVYWFAPDYIVLDKNLSDYNDFLNSSFNVYGYMGKNYSVYYNASGFYIYKRK